MVITHRNMLISRSIRRHDSDHMDEDSGLFVEGNPGEGEARSPIIEPPPRKTARVSKRKRLMDEAVCLMSSAEIVQGND